MTTTSLAAERPTNRMHRVAGLHVAYVMGGIAERVNQL